MSDTTTVRVSTGTREHLNRISAQRGETVDATIQRGLRLIEREAWRAQAEIDARAAAADPADRAEVAAAIRDLTGE
jgi:predicted transcriptional regulator